MRKKGSLNMTGTNKTKTKKRYPFTSPYPHERLWRHTPARHRLERSVHRLLQLAHALPQPPIFHTNALDISPITLLLLPSLEESPHARFRHGDVIAGTVVVGPPRISQRRGVLRFCTLRRNLVTTTLAVVVLVIRLFVYLFGRGHDGARPRVAAGEDRDRVDITFEAGVARGRGAFATRTDSPG